MPVSASQRLHRPERGNVVGCGRGLRKNPQVGRLALHLPVVEGIGEGASGIAPQRELEARILPRMHGVAARMARVEARTQCLDRRGGFGPRERVLRQCQAQQQRVDAALGLQQGEHVGRSILIEQPIAYAPSRYASLSPAPSAARKCRSGGGIAPTVRNFAEQRFGPDAAGVVHAWRRLQRSLQRVVRGAGLAGHAVDRGETDHAIDRWCEAIQTLRSRAAPRQTCLAP